MAKEESAEPKQKEDPAEVIEDLTWLKSHNDSRKIMILLLIHLLDEDSSTDELF